MDRYFYSVEMEENHKVVHLSGNIYYNNVDETETCFRIATWTGFYFTMKELKWFIEKDCFHDYINEEVDYMGDLTEEEAAEMCQTYFNGAPGRLLNIKHVNEDTPCGDYWFE